MTYRITIGDGRPDSDTYLETRQIITNASQVGQVLTYWEKLGWTALFAESFEAGSKQALDNSAANAAASAFIATVLAKASATVTTP